MELAHDYTLTVADVAAHYALSRRTIRNCLKDGSLSGVQVNGQWRCSWTDVWRAEKGPMPRGKRSKAYKADLLTKRSLALEWSVSERTVERWIAAGLPTRNVFGSVRIAPVDAVEWMRQNFVGSGNAA
ncbi:helix-turn-helix domain-containing protein (plasmid) [Roseivivax marinus]|uniref:helix-turn-helix domain-containing protein n=1 Tax=Roseivivax marinus TaxID=1379903 RepID=UPI001F04ED4F|nr:helix-turn-helix domain-containing protein [Roseivivax marinus]UMA67247.1 helix-turn-helix domain-containing protein [Roseivivax marinus]